MEALPRIGGTAPEGSRPASLPRIVVYDERIADLFHGYLSSLPGKDRQ